MTQPAMTLRVAAVDLGATSGRVMAARVGPGHLSLKEVHRFPNGGVPVGGSLFWDVLGIHREVLAGVAEVARTGELHGIGIDSWAVDYGLLDRDGELLGNPYSHRDPRTRDVPELVAKTVSVQEQYAVNGLQQLPFTTVFQLVAARGTAALESAHTMLLLPDLLGYWLTGEVGAERTNASTTGLLDVRTGAWSSELASRLQLPWSILPPLRDAGSVVGPLRAEVAADLGLAPDVPVVAVGSHDTASAVVGRPRGLGHLLRLHLLGHVVARRPRARRAGAHRGGPRGRLHQRGRRRRHRPLPQERDGPLGALGVPQGVARPRHPRHRPRLPARRRQHRGAAAHRRRHQPPVPARPGKRHRPDARARRPAGARTPASRSRRRPARSPAASSTASPLAYRRHLRTAARLAGRDLEVVHVVGGGSHNHLLCQLTADALGVPVLAGPGEAAALGNALVQARALGADLPDLAAMRALVRETHDVRRHDPRPGLDWDAADRRVDASGSG